MLTNGTSPSAWHFVCMAKTTKQRPSCHNLSDPTASRVEHPCVIALVLACFISCPVLSMIEFAKPPFTPQLWPFTLIGISHEKLPKKCQSFLMCEEAKVG